jgi:phthalate 4,5-cis-dihydrodiol dehydrogenase
MEVASNPKAPAKEERVKQVRIGLVGAGAQMLDCLYPALLSVEDVTICGVCDVVQDRAVSLAGHISTAESFSEIGKMVSQTAPDVLIAACPPEGHEEILWAALADDVPAFVEKPPARSLGSLEELSSAIEAKNLATGVGMNFRYSTPYLAFKKLLDSGEHGRPVSVTVTHVANKPRASLWGYDLLWSVLLAQSVHPVNLVLDLIGKVERIESVEQRTGDRLFLGTQLRGSSGALGNVVVATGAQRFHFSIHVVTDLGAVLTSTDLMDVVLRPADTGEQGAKVVWNASPLDRGHRRSGYASELGALCDAVRLGRPFSPDVPSLIPTYEVLTEVARG